MQRTFGKSFGQDPVVNSRSMPDDTVIASDGQPIRLGDAHIDCRDNPHRTEDECFDANVEIVTEILMSHDEWVTDYCTENTDYPDGYVHIVGECSHDWPERIEEWIRDEDGGSDGYTDYEDYFNKVVAAVHDRIDGEFDIECKYDANEYARWIGPGCCLYSLDIGEYENQIEISSHPELQALHDARILDDILDHVNCDVYVSRSKDRVLNEETDRYEYVGRETYGPDAKYPCLWVYHMPGGQWHYVVPDDSMREYLANAIVDVAREIDTPQQ